MPGGSPTCTNLPALSVFVVKVWFLSSCLSCTVTSGYGLPFASSTCPSMRPVFCAAAAPARTTTRPSTFHILKIRLIITASLRLGCAGLLSRNSRPVGDSVVLIRLGKGPLAQPATVACSAGLVFELVAGPGELERRAQPRPASHDLALAHADDGRRDLNLRLRARPGGHQLRKHAVIFLPAIRIAGAILRHGADENRRGPDHLRPAHRRGKKMGVAKRNVGDGDSGRALRRGSRILLGNGNPRVGPPRPADLRRPV